MNYKADKSRQKAKELLSWYLNLVATHSRPLNWNNDNQVEVEQIVDLIIKVAIEEMKEEIKILLEGQNG